MEFPAVLGVFLSKETSGAGSNRTLCQIADMTCHVAFCHAFGAPKSGVGKRVLSKRVVLADVPLERKQNTRADVPRNEETERGYIRMFPWN